MTMDVLERWAPLEVALVLCLTVILAPALQRAIAAGWKRWTNRRRRNGHPRA